MGGDDDEVIVDEGKEDIYMRLSINAYGKALTRAGYDGERPYGGEDGDGAEAARNNENNIDDITIFIYNSTKGINDDPATTIKFAKYFNKLKLDSSSTYTTAPLKLSSSTDAKKYIPASGDRILIVVNAGDLSSMTTLGAVREATINRAWIADTDITKYSHFAMSSAYEDDGEIELSHSGEYADPFEAEVSVERVAARIDFSFSQSLGSVSRSPIIYPVEAVPGDEFHLSHIRIVNASIAPAYSFKRTATSVNPSLDGVKYLGDETYQEVTHGTKTYRIPTNYVVDPQTTQRKDGATISDLDATLISWYGGSTLEESFNASFSSYDTYKVHSSTGDGEVFTADGNNCFILGYVMENTMDKSCVDGRMMTALQIRGTYVPAKVYTFVDDASKLYKEEYTPYTAGTTFYYCEHPTDASLSYAFKSETDASNFKDKNAGYKVYKYENGVCYYHVYIRHAMYDKETDAAAEHKSGNFPMEYGIVRNNIYRIYVEKVSKIGPTEPNPEIPDLIYSHLYIRDWRSRIHDNILL